MNVVIRIAITILFCIPLIISIPASAAEKMKKMEPLYDLKSAASIEPTVYHVEKDIYTLFPVMRGNATHAGTVSLNHAITVLSFNKDKLIREEFFRDVFNDLQLDSTVKVIPAIAPDILGLGYKRRLIIFDLKKKYHKEFYITLSLEQSIQRIAIADAQQRHFIFESMKFNKLSNDHNDYTKVLLLMELKDDEPKLMKEVDIGRTTVWTSLGNDHILYNLKTKDLNIINRNFDAASHPLLDVIKRNKNMESFTRLAPHPSLPFIILYGGGDAPDRLLTWGAGKDNQPKALLKSGMSNVLFSPDGKWVIYKQHISLNEDRTYLMPVSEKYPYYLGTPILLWKKRFQPDQIVWTTNPISFVGAYGDSLYRWELTKEAQRTTMGNDFDKYATFHDWIVTKDLEKLTKEKKQGLGK